MWNSTRSTKLSLICTRIVMGLVIAMMVFLPKLIRIYGEIAGGMVDKGGLIALMVILYGCCIPAAVALFSLDRMLTNIAKGEVFVDKNVKYLRAISWACILASILCLFMVKYYILFVFVAIAAAFIGLILRVVKNVIEEAIILKNENDFTI